MRAGLATGPWAAVAIIGRGPGALALRTVVDSSVFQV